MKPAAALGGEPAAQRGSASRWQLIAGIVVGLSTAGLISAVRSAKRTQASAAASTTIPVSSPSAARDAPIDFQEVRRKEVQAHRDAVAKHLSEAPDPLWAPATAKSLRDLLERLMDRGQFSITSVDCRTTSCVAELSFPSYAVARQKWGLILNTPNMLRCGTEITLEDPQNGAKSYSLSVVYDCAEGRRIALDAGPEPHG